MKELTYTLTELDHIRVVDSNGNVYYGCDQEWFGSIWQRMAGCGPTVAANIILYLQKGQSICIPLSVDTKSDCVTLMESVWRHVTPTARGIYLVEQLSDGVQKFAQANGFSLDCFSLSVPKSVKERPGLSSVIGFIADGLLHDCPVAFLNLSNGKVNNLDEWHWVTIVSLETDQDNETANALIYDGAKPFTVDLKLWYETTKLGGGFVYFVRNPNENPSNRAV